MYKISKTPLAVQIANGLSPFAVLLATSLAHGATVVEQTSYGYDAAGNLQTRTDGAGNATNYSYYPSGQLKTVIDPLLRSTQLGYDLYDRQTSSQGPAGSVVYVYDNGGNVSTATDPRGLVTHYQFNALQLATQIASPDAGQTALSYDTAGLPYTRQDARGQTSTIKRDTVGRISTITYSSGLTLSYGYGSDGRLSSIGDGSNTVGYQYDGAGRINADVRQVLGHSYTTGYLYDAQGRLITMTYPSGLSLSYAYTASGKLRSITRSNGTSQVLVDQVAWRPFGPINAWRYGNGLTQNYAYDIAGNVTGYQLGNASVTLGYDAAGRVSTQQISGGWWQALLQKLGLPTGTADGYQYDTADRLLQWQNGGTTVGAYSVDANGNRTSTTLGGQGQTMTVDGASNRTSAAGGRTLQYDAAGNLLSDGVHSYTYDARGHMASADSATYTLNPLGERVAKTWKGQTTVFHYDLAHHLIAESDSLGNVEREYVYLGDTLVAVIDAGTTVEYVHADPLGTPRLLTNAAQQPIWSWLGEPFGTAQPDQDPGRTGTAYVFNLRFPGQYYDAETGLHYNLNRDYDPNTGRYVESDPLGLAGGQWSTYAYVDGNPLSYSDPLGLWPFGAPKSGFDFGKTHVPSQQEVINQLQKALVQGGTCKDKDQAHQIASDITDKVGWGDLGLAQSLVDSLNSGKPLTNSQQTAAQKFINQLPAPDQGPLKQLLLGGKK